MLNGELMGPQALQRMMGTDLGVGDRQPRFLPGGSPEVGNLQRSMFKRASSNVQQDVPQSVECEGALLFNFCDPERDGDYERRRAKYHARALRESGDQGPNWCSRAFSAGGKSLKGQVIDTFSQQV
jgi:hypothetical protein